MREKPRVTSVLFTDNTREWAVTYKGAVQWCTTWQDALNLAHEMRNPMLTGKTQVVPVDNGKYILTLDGTIQTDEPLPYAEAARNAETVDTINAALYDMFGTELLYRTTDWPAGQWPVDVDGSQ